MWLNVVDLVSELYEDHTSDEMWLLRRLLLRRLGRIPAVDRTPLHMWLLRRLGLILGDKSFLRVIRFEAQHGERVGRIWTTFWQSVGASILSSVVCAHSISSLLCAVMSRV